MAVAFLQPAFVLINNSVPPQHIGKANALANATTSLCRALFPTIGGAAWNAVAESLPFWPALPHLPFIIPLAMSVVQLWLAMVMPKSLDSPHPT
eukprot:SAG22_NODE_318_length_12494_cov_18.507705_9_plen_94_part_00